MYTIGCTCFRHGINSGIGIDYLTKMELKELYAQINLPFKFLIQKYLFHDNPSWNIN